MQAEREGGILERVGDAEPAGEGGVRGEREELGEGEEVVVRLNSGEVFSAGMILRTALAMPSQDLEHSTLARSAKRYAR